MGDQAVTLRNWRVCQVCGAVRSPEDARAEGWFVSPHRLVPDVLVVRCYRHISMKSLMISVDGRTKDNMELMRRGRERAAKEPPYNPAIEPFPLTDRPKD